MGEMECIFYIGKKYFYFGQGYSGERCGPWASCFVSPASVKEKWHMQLQSKVKEDENVSMSGLLILIYL
jgi:hypothetical protein